MATFGTLITRCLTRLRQQGGLDVNVYSQPVIAEMLQHKFDTLFDRRFWDRHLVSSTWALDGTTGLITADISALVKQFNDIKNVWPDGYRNPIPRLDKNVNPEYVNNTVFAPHAVATKVFKIYPVTTSGTITVSYRTKSTPFVEDDEVPFDEQCLILGTCYDFLSDDGADRVMIEKFMGMYRDRLDRLEKLEDQHGHSLHSQTAAIVTEWHDR